MGRETDGYELDSNEDDGLLWESFSSFSVFRYLHVTLIVSDKTTSGSSILNPRTSQMLLSIVRIQEWLNGL